MRPPLRVVLGIGVAAVTVSALTAAAVGFGGDRSGTAEAAGPTLSTTRVTRATLTQTERVDGRLDYGAPVTVNGRGTGVITWLPSPGAVIRRGQPVYLADDRPVSLFYGTRPLYRRVRAGDAGRDVEEVERNLAALGYTGPTVDTRYTSATAAAVRRWQTASGRTPTGILDPADVVIAPAQVRVASLIAHLGDQADGPTLTYTGTTRVVRIDLEVALQGMARAGAAATVTVPNGKVVNGRIAAVSTVAVAPAEDAPGEGQESGEDEQATIEVTVTVADQSAFGTLDRAPVTVELVSATEENVLTVPVAALVALAEGGYGVQAVTGSTSRYVAVRLGMFANGRVQITGEGVTDGMLVVVPS